MSRISGKNEDGTPNRKLRPEAEGEARPIDRPKKKRPPKFLTEHELAERWTVSVQYIRKLRYSGDGPIFTSFGRAVRYKLQCVIRHEKKCEFKNTSERDLRRSLTGAAQI